MKTVLGAALLAATMLGSPAFAASDVVTIYSADGLHDGKNSWYEQEFAAFTKATGIKVQYIEAGSGGVVERIAKEKSNPQADVLVTLPPFIQRAEAEGLLQGYTPEAASEIAGGDDHYQPLVANYITDSYTIQRERNQSLMALYIGSSIGNFSPSEATGILRNLRRQLRKTGDTLLLGVDLAPCRNKSVDFLLAAYDDAAGTTAEFNLNVLARLNRDLDADFDLACFAHRARWNAAESRIEMHLESLCHQQIEIGGKTISFVPGETIHTENSYKYTERSFRKLLDNAGFGSPQWFHDSAHHFGVSVAHPA